MSFIDRIFIDEFHIAFFLYGVTTENGKNSTLSDLVFVKVIDN